MRSIVVLLYVSITIGHWGLITHSTQTDVTLMGNYNFHITRDSSNFMKLKYL